MSGGHTPGPWPISNTGDGKRIIVGEGLVEGPNGYEVAEVYADDCPRETAEANARLIAAAPDLLAALERARDWIVGQAAKDEYPEDWGVVSTIDAAIARTKTGEPA